MSDEPLSVAGGLLAADDHGMEPQAELTDMIGNVAEIKTTAYEPRCLRQGCDQGVLGTPWTGTRTLDRAAAQAEMDAHWQQHQDSEARLERIDQLAGDIERAWTAYGLRPGRDQAPSLFRVLAGCLVDDGWCRPQIMQEMIDAAMGRAPAPGEPEVLVPPADLDEEPAPEDLTQQAVPAVRWHDGHLHDAAASQHGWPGGWVAHDGYQPHVHDPETGRTLFRGDYNRRGSPAGTAQPGDQDWRVVP